MAKVGPSEPPVRPPRPGECWTLHQKCYKSSEKKGNLIGFPARYYVKKFVSTRPFPSIPAARRLVKVRISPVKGKRDPNQEIRSGLLFSLASCAKEGLDLHQAQLKLFLAIDPIKHKNHLPVFQLVLKSRAHPTLEKKEQDHSRT